MQVTFSFVYMLLLCFSLRRLLSTLPFELVRFLFISGNHVFILIFGHPDLGLVSVIKCRSEK